MSRLAIFVSGSGTNMENLIKISKEGRLAGGEVFLVISDKPEVPAIQKAQKEGVTVAVIDRKIFKSREEFEAAIVDQLTQEKIDWLILAGFMRLLSSDFVRRYQGKIINIHPSLLPAFPGAHGIKDAYEAKAVETGVTVHFVDDGVDTGPVILQRKLKVEPKETLEGLEKRIHALEYEVFPEALRLVFNGKVRLPSHHREDEYWTKD